MPPRLRPTRLEHVVDGVRLRVQLTAAAQDWAGDAVGQRRHALLILKAALFRGRMIAKERLESGAGGIETARLLSGVVDEVVGAFYDFTTVHVFRARNPTAGERLAVMAVGGYGRGALAPFSDIDLLFLRTWKPTAHTESVIEYMLYGLWDLGFKVGHASRTLDECVKLAREDMTIRTALLEARRLAGDERLAADLTRRFRAEVQAGTAAEFVAAKLKERDERHARAGTSRYLVEPNVKEGKGGLRDLNTLFWIARYLHPSDDGGEIVRLREFTGRELRACIRAFDFLWAVRAHLHFVTGRAEERLSFDVQPEVAVRMGYGGAFHAAHAEPPAGPMVDNAEATRAVERFMRRYFLIAREVGALTRVFCAKLEDEHARPAPALWGLLRPSPAKARALEPGFALLGGRLALQDPGVLERDPVNMIRLFGVVDRRSLDLHPDAFSAVTRALNLITPALRKSPEAAKAFLQILARGRQTRRTLELMNETGVLGRYLPEFGRIVGQMQFNMYHSYTVDEHTLRAVGVIADIVAGRLEADHPLATSVVPKIADAEALFLAMLLHDTGKGGAGGQEVEGAKAAAAACARLGLAPERTDLVAWLIGHHLAMSDYAQKRDIGDQRTIAAFARLVENPERLRLLLVLTVADIRAIGPGVWNGWKGQLLRDLYAATEALFRGGRGSHEGPHVAEERRFAAADARARLIATDGRDPALPAWAEAMEDAYVAAFDSADQLRHFALAKRAGAAAAAEARALPECNATELAIVARDRRGLFADLAGVLAAYGANVIGARVYTSATGQALDVFHVQDVGGEAFGAHDAARLVRLSRALEAAGRGEAHALEPARPLDQARASAFAVPADAAVDNEASDVASVIEVSGRDRPGLLEALARTLAGAGLQLISAHVDCYGERAVDAFYVTAADGAKLAEPAAIAQLKNALIEALRADEAAPRRRLQRARASAAR